MEKNEFNKIAEALAPIVKQIARSCVNDDNSPIDDRLKAAIALIEATNADAHDLYNIAYHHSREWVNMHKVDLMNLLVEAADAIDGAVRVIKQAVTEAGAVVNVSADAFRDVFRNKRRD